MDGVRKSRQREGRTWSDEKKGIVGLDGKKAGKCSPVIGVHFGDRKNSPINILKRSIRRAWTINVPPGRWTISRKSPAFRIYRSLPLNKNNRGEQVRENTETKDFIVKTEARNSRNKLNNIQLVDIECNSENNSVRSSTSKSLLKCATRFNSPETRSSPKYGERKSNIPIFRRNSREFEDISSPRESPKRSLIPQRYRGSTDDLRRYREDTSIPSLIPKLQISQKNKEEKFKRYPENKVEVKPASQSFKKEFSSREKEDTRLRYSPTFARKFPQSDINLNSSKSKLDSLQNSLTNEAEVENLSRDSEAEEKYTDGKFDVIMANEKIGIEEQQCHDEKDAMNDEKIVFSELQGDRDSFDIGDKNPETSTDISTASDTENSGIANDEVKNICDISQTRRNDDTLQVIRRKYSKEEFSNTDDTDDAPNRRSSSHLSPEASPLSTRSSRYSPRESESEPTPALPRKTSNGDSCISSQRIRDAITRTRRESNSSTRYESSGSESVRLSESGLHNYVDLARKVRLFGNNYCCPGASIDEPIQRDSATSAGEDDPHEDCLSRDSSRLAGISNQGRTILRRRRQFDPQGSRRRGRSHARTCCSEELQNLQTTRQGRILHSQEHPNPDYRRLVFISSDSSSGREEDDADSSCSGSSYLNGLPRNAQGLEDCDWDYFESGTLPLPTNLTDNISIDHISNVGNHVKASSRDWSCCLGRGSACSACGGSPGTNVLPVPVPIPVPVPYPVPVPASLWNGDFAAAANSMITGSTTPEGTLRLRGDPTAPWFSWHPRFNQPLQGTIQRGRMPGGGFDPSIFMFRPDEISLSHYELSNEQENVTIAAEVTGKQDDSQTIQTQTIEKKTENSEVKQTDLNSEVIPGNSQGESQQNVNSNEKLTDNNDKIETKKEDLAVGMSNENEVKTNNDKSIKKRRGYCLSHNDSGSSSGRSSADSSDLDESSSHRFSRVFVVNDNSYTSDNDIEDIGDIDGNIEAPNQDVEDGITLKHMVALSDEESPVVLQHIRTLRNDFNEETSDEDSENSECWPEVVKSHELINKKEFVESGEISLTDSIDNCPDNNHVQLRSIRRINSDTGLPNSRNEHLVLNVQELAAEIKSWDSSVTPDSLEVIDVKENITDTSTILNVINNDNNLININDTSVVLSSQIHKIIELKLNSSTDSSETNTTGSEFSSDELHEYEISCFDNNSPIQSTIENNKTVHKTTPMPKRNFRLLDTMQEEGKKLVNKKLSLIESNSDENLINQQNEKFEEFEYNDANNDNNIVKGEKLDGRQVGDNVSSSSSSSSNGGGNNSGEMLKQETSRFCSVERCPPTRKENGELQLPTITEQSTTGQNYSQINKYKSLVMITQETYQPVSVITSDTTTLLEPDETQTPQGLAGYYHLALEAVQEPQRSGQVPRRPLMIKRLISKQGNHITGIEQEVDSGLSVGSASESDDVQSVKNPKHCLSVKNNYNDEQQQNSSRRQKILPTELLSDIHNNHNIQTERNEDIVILEEGLADDDSWVEEVSHDEDEQSATATEESSEDEGNNLGDREEELRGYHRQAIDFTLHTIVEESCEESEAEPSLSSSGSPRKKQRPPSASELEKYFFFGLGGDGNSGGNGNSGSREIDSLSETSSIYSEGLESLGHDDNNSKEKNSSDFANSSRLEKYFLSEFLGFDQDRRDSDGSVGSDSEGRPSPEAQRRKRLVRARGTGRSHSSSLDNLLALNQSNQNLSSQNSLQDLSIQDSQETQSEGSSTETDGAEDGQTAAFGTDGQFDTVKRKKKKPRNLGTQSPRFAEDRNKSPDRELSFARSSEVLNDNDQGNSEDERSKTPQPEMTTSPSSSSTSGSISSSTPDASSAGNFGDTRGKQQSRDSGFVGSCDDLLQGHQKSQTDPKLDGSKNHLFQNDAHKESGKKTDFSHNKKNFSSTNPSLSRKDSFNNWSSDEETNLMMSKMRQFFKTMVANSNGQSAPAPTTTPTSNSSGPSPSPSPRQSVYTSAKSRLCPQNRTKPPQLVYFENELTRLMKTVPGIRDEQVREIVEYLSSEDTWSDSYDSSDYTSSDLEGAGGRRSALQEQISQSCQQIINKFDINSDTLNMGGKEKEENSGKTQPSVGRDTAFVYQKLVQSFTKMAGDNNNVSSDASSTPHSSPPLIAKVMHHIGSRLVALMHEVSENNSTVHNHSHWRRYSQHHRTPSSASTTEDDDSTSDSAAPATTHFQLPRSKSHDPLLLLNGHPTVTAGQEGEEREASDYERFSWRGSFESALMAADSRTKLSLLACSGDVNASTSASAMAAKRRSAGDLLFNPKSFSREQLDRVRSCGSIGGGNGNVNSTSGNTVGGSIEEKIWSNRRRSSVPDANTRGESGASAGDEDTEDEMEYNQDSRATTLPRGLQATTSTNGATNSLPRLPASASSGVAMMSNTSMHKAHSMYHFLPQHTGVKSARYRPPGFARNSLSNVGNSGVVGPKRAFSAPGLQIASQSAAGKRETSRSRRQQTLSLSPDDGSSLSEACCTPIIGVSPRPNSSRAVNDIGIDELERGGLHPGHNNLNTRASLSSLGARSDSMASVYSGAGEGRWCGSVAVRGEVEFSLQYDYKQLTFEVHVSQCKDLAPVDIKRNRSDPYVKVYLLPDKSKGGKRKTKVKKHTLNPVFDETLKFNMSLNGLETRTLWLTVWHSDMFGRNDFLGEVRMPLENKIFDDPTPRWYPLQERTEPFDDPISYKGEVIVGLKFVPPDPAQLDRDIGNDRGLTKGKKNWSRGSLHVLVKEARNLQTRAKNTGTCDPFCKSYLLPDKGRSGKQKTGVVRRSGGSPVWGHTFIYKDVSLQELADRGLELTVWDHDRIASNEFLGGVRFNLGTGKHYGKPVDWMDATGRELSLWQNMLERPNFWVEGAVTLRPNLHNHVKSSVP